MDGKLSGESLSRTTAGGETRLRRQRPLKSLSEGMLGQHQPEHDLSLSSILSAALCYSATPWIFSPVTFAGTMILFQGSNYRMAKITKQLLGNRELKIWNSFDVF